MSGAATNTLNLRRIGRSWVWALPVLGVVALVLTWERELPVLIYIVVGVVLILLSPLAGVIPGPGGIFVFANRDPTIAELGTGQQPGDDQPERDQSQRCVEEEGGAGV